MLFCQYKPLAFSPFLLSLPLLKLSIDPFTALYLLLSNAKPDIVIKFILPLCLKTLILAPESLAPKIREVWLSSSLMIKSPFPTRAGIFAELVANPIPNTIAAGLPTNRATRPSSSL